MVAQVTNETSAITNSSGVQAALTEGSYNFQSKKYDLYSTKAESEHNLGSRDNALALETGAQSAVLGVIATIQVAVEQVAQMKEIGKAEVADKTNEGVKAEMKVAQAVSEDKSRKGATLDLEAKLEATAKASAPKVG